MNPVGAGHPQPVIAGRSDARVIGPGIGTLKTQLSITVRGDLRHVTIARDEQAVLRIHGQLRHDGQILGHFGQRFDQQPVTNADRLAPQ